MSLADRVADHLSALHIEFVRLDESHIGLSFHAPHLSYQVLVTAENSLISFLVPGIVTVPEARLVELLRLANAINTTRIRLGAFSVGSDGFLCFEVTLVATEDPSIDQIALAVASLNAVNSHFPAFALVLWAGASAIAALEALQDVPVDPPSPPNGDEIDEAV